MNYKAGDRVKIKSIDWYNENKSKSHGTVACGGKYFDYDMRNWCGKTMTILKVYQTYYAMEEDYISQFYWTDEMIEGLAEDEIGLVDKLSSRWVNEFNLPDGYIFKDENGNVINAKKIILEKKKKEYPKTYEECCDKINFKGGFEEILLSDDEYSLYIPFIKLKRCRNAYWKIAGEEMGLGKPWEPNWHDDEKKYTIEYCDGEIIKDFSLRENRIFSFPTKEMRDAFYENFKKEIEICRELL